MVDEQDIRQVIERLRRECKDLSIHKRNERAIYQCKMAQICVLEKILRGENKMDELTTSLQKGFVQVLIDIEGYLLEDNKEECLDYVLKVKKEILDDIDN